jgi:ADP-ribosyl-[dinitrogen reductase] hydrolase
VTFPPARSTSARVRAGVLAYAAGDALGVPWEGQPPSAISWEAMDRLPTRADWPAGATSDDTEQLVLMAGYLTELGAVVDERRFLTRLAAALPGMREAGPSTRAAVQRFTASGALRADGGDTNGAAMRAPPIGWAVPAAAAQRRRELSIGLSRTTHGAGGAIGSACAVSAMASRAIEASPLRGIIDAAIDEITWLETEFPNSRTIFQPARRAGSGDGSPNPAGVSLNAVETLAAVVHVLGHAARKSFELADALRYAVSLGGDTDTVAAIVGGILGSRLEDVAGIPWLSRVALPDSVELDTLSMALSSLRQSLGP